MSVFENLYYQIRFNDETGAIESLMVKETGWNLIRQPKLAMGIRMLVPLNDIRNNPVSSCDQQLSRLHIDQDQAVLTWDTLRSRHVGSLNITVTQTIRFVGCQIHFDISIDNKSPHMIEEIWSPYLGGIREPAGEEPLSVYTLDSVANISQTVLGERFHNELGYWGTDHPTMVRSFPDKSNHASFELLTNNKQGFYIGSHDPNLDVVHFVHEFRPGYLDSRHNRVTLDDMIGTLPAGYLLGVVKMPYLQPGEKTHLSPVVMEYFQGDWHQGIQIYQQYRESWLKFKPIPTWVKDVDCWMTLHMNSPENCLRYTYKDLPNVMKGARARGVKALQLIGWAIGGQDGDEPYQDHDPILGSKEELIDAIKAIEAMGIRVILMCKFKWADQTTLLYKQELQALSAKDRYGVPIHFGGYSYQTMAQHMNGAARRTGTAMCHLAQEYQGIALREFKKILDLGASGILYDELNNHHMTTCFDTSHQHRYGESIFKGSLALAEAFHQLATSVNPEFLMAAEGPKDPLTQYYPVNYIRSWFGHRPAWKYMDPEALIATCVTGFDDREMVNQCLVYGYIINYEPYNFKGTLDDIPMTVEYGMRALNLRKKLWDNLWRGILKDTDGVHLDLEDAAVEHIYNVFIHPETKEQAIVIANQDAHKILKGHIVMAESKTSYDIHHIENDTVDQTSGSFIIQPRSLIVLIAHP